MDNPNFDPPKKMPKTTKFCLTVDIDAQEYDKKEVSAFTVDDQNISWTVDPSIMDILQGFRA